MPPRRGRLGLDRLRRCEHRDLDVPLLGQRAGRERSIARPGDRHGQGPAGSDRLRPAPIPARAGNEDDPVPVRKPTLETQLPQQRAIEREHRQDRPDYPPSCLDADGPGRLDRPAPPNREAVGPDNRDVAREPAETAETQAPLDVAATGQVARQRCDVVRLSFVRRQHGPQLGLEARVDPPLLGALRDRAEAPEGSRQRRDREEEEIDREFVLEASEHRPIFRRLCPPCRRAGSLA